MPTVPPILIVVLLGVAGVLFMFNRRQRARALREQRAAWGGALDRERNMEAIASYYRGVAAHVAPALDDRTWDDLDMDAVFALLDRTESAVGQQLLYSRLRANGRASGAGPFEALVTRMSDDVAARERAQLVLRSLRASAAYDLWWLAMPGTLATERRHVLFPVAGLSMVVLVAASVFWPPALFLLMVGAMGSILLRASVAQRLRVVTGAFRELAPLLAAAEVFVALDLPETASSLRLDLPRLARLRSIAAWAGRDSARAVAGDMQEILFEYLNLLFWLDANALFFGARELGRRGSELLRVIAAVGDVDAAISIASYRAGTSGWTRPTFRSRTVILDAARHPLLPHAVPNSVAMTAPEGMIVTGSNMSGKTTFLRTVGVTAVLAQTINTCLAVRYEAPEFVVRSCIGRADDLQSGKSYYFAEVESVVSIVRSARGSASHLLLFDELFRGTNTVERIAAAEAVLLSLLAPATGEPTAHVVLAATHDGELVTLLEGVYGAYHFADAIGPAGLSFDYLLRPGAARTRNAIALIAQQGAPAALIEHARERARQLEEARTVALDELGRQA
ncbi:MAG TPA: hypothetical protein VFV95_15090 [Vicinamibacterales bacterium]|nr:hypothetical protein [Vicinamibacterales bacterium]